MITVVTGDFFASRASVLVNPVNCEGVVDGLVSGAFADRFPDNQSFYDDACDEGDLHPGGLIVYHNPAPNNPRVILNCAVRPTADVAPSIVTISVLAANIARYLSAYPTKSLALPALGVGIGKLPWLVVRDVLLSAFRAVECEVYLYKPADELLSPQDTGACMGDAGVDFPARCMLGVQPSVGQTVSLIDHIRSVRDAKEAAPYTRRLGVYHPSSLASDGVCYRALAYERLGLAPHKKAIGNKMAAWFGMGNVLHDMVQVELGSIRGREGQRFQSEVKCEYKHLNIMGHCDGTFGDWVVELKGISTKGFTALRKPQRVHIRQVHCYMLALDIPRTIFLYLCRDDGQMKEFRIHFDMAVFRVIVDRIAHVEAFLDRGELPPQDAPEYKCKGCKYEYACEPKFKKKRVAE